MCEHFNEMPYRRNHLLCHVTSPTNYFKHSSFKYVDFSEMYILSNYKYQFAISMNIQKDYTRVSREDVPACKDPYLVLNNNIYKE